MAWDDEETRERVARAEELLAGLDALPGDAAARAGDAVEALVALYGECLARVMAQLAAPGPEPTGGGADGGGADGGGAAEVPAGVGADVGPPGAGSGGGEWGDGPGAGGATGGEPGRVARADASLSGAPPSGGPRPDGEPVPGGTPPCAPPPGRLRPTGSDPSDLVRRLADDELVGHLLLVHDLHPDPLPTRVLRALADLGARAAGAEPVEVSDRLVRVRLAGGGGCSSGSAAAERAVREAVVARAPEVERVEVEAAPQERPLIPVAALFAQDRTPIGRESG